jgi:hypothetical protein
MTKEHYMALADFQTLWDDSLKPHISSTYATKQEVPETITSNSASVDTCISIVDELS